MDTSPKQLSLSLSGLSAIFIGIGIGRLAYTPLLPVLIQNGWLTSFEASFLGAANFVGYLLGAIFAKKLTVYIKSPKLIKFSMVSCTLSLMACAVNFGVIWLNGWRFIAGVAGAILMIVAPSFILKNIAVSHRGKINGLIFTGIGLGIIVSGLLVPSLIKIGLVTTWLSLAALSVIAMLLAWPVISSNALENDIPKTNKDTKLQSLSQPIVLLIIAYSLYGVGFIPHMLFLVEYISQQLNYGINTGGWIWSLLGAGSLLGAFSLGAIADFFGAQKTLIGTYFVSFLAILLIFFTHHIIVLGISAFLIGALLPGIVTLTSTRAMELASTSYSHSTLWSLMTIAYAISQALGAYFMSYIFYKTGSYDVCFIIAAISMLTATVLVSIKNVNYKAKLSIEIIRQ